MSEPIAAAMHVFKVTGVPSKGRKHFDRPGLPARPFYRETEVQAENEEHARAIALERWHQYSGAAQCELNPTSVMAIWREVQETVPEHNRRAELHSRAGAALAAGQVKPADPQPGVGDPRPYRVLHVEKVAG